MRRGAKHFEIRLSDMPEPATEEIRHTVGNYTIPLIVDETPLGSGSLVSVDGHYGILTAEHVVHPPHRPSLTLDYTGFPERFLVTSVAGFPHEVKISTNALRFFSTPERPSDAFGPDLAFILLPPSPFLEELKARLSFSNLTFASRKKVAMGRRDHGFMCFSGYPGECHLSMPPARGFQKVTQLVGYSFMTGPEKYQPRRGWDYYELGVSRKDIAGTLTKFGGVSGGGLWRTPVYRKAGDPVGKEFINEVVLCGVAFYEEDRRRGRFFVRAHGPVSLYRKFLPQLRKFLKASVPLAQ